MLAQEWHRAAFHTNYNKLPEIPIQRPNEIKLYNLSAAPIQRTAKRLLLQPSKSLAPPCLRAAASNPGPRSQASTKLISQASNAVKQLRELVKVPRSARGNVNTFDRRIDELAAQFRIDTADGTRASSRDLGSAVWCLAKLATPCCRRHAAVLLRSLTASPTALAAASTQTLCNALYGAALLSKEGGSTGFPAGGFDAVSSSSFSSSSADAFTDANAASLDVAAVAVAASVLAAACLPRLSAFNPQDTSNVWWAIATLSALPPPPPPAAAAATAASSHRHQQHQQRSEHGAFVLPEGLLEGLATTAVRHMRSAALAPTPYSSAVAPAKGGGGNGGGNGGGCSPLALANMLWGACKLGYVDERMLGAAVELLKPQIRELMSSDPRAIATCLWALASLRYPAAEGLLAAASRPAAARMRAFDDQSLTILLWSYGTANVLAPRLFSAAADEVARRANWMGLNFLGTCLWAFATANHPAPRMMAAVADSLTAGAPAPAAPPAPASLRLERAPAWAQAHVGSCRIGSESAEVGGRDGLAEAEAALAERLASCDGRRTQALGNLAWSYAALRTRHDPLLGALMGRAAAAAPALNAQELSNVLYGAARLMPYMANMHPRVLEGLLQEVDRRLLAASSNPNRHNDQRLTPRDLAMLAWSVAILDPGSPTLHRLLAAAIAATAGNSDDGDSEEHGAIDGGGADGEGLRAQPYNLFGLVQLYGANYAACLAEAQGACSSSDFAAGGDGLVCAVVRAAAAAMRQAKSAAEAIGGTPQGSGGATATAGEEMVRFGPLGTSPALFRAGRDAWFLNTAGTKSSDLQAAVLAALRDGGSGCGVRGSAATATAAALTVTEEALSPDRMLRVDLLIQYDKWLVMLEVDGPTHFAIELAESHGSGGHDSLGGGENWQSGGSEDDDDGGGGGSSGNGSVATAAAAVAQRRDPRRELRPLGDTVLRNRFLAASLGLPAPGGPGSRNEGSGGVSSVIPPDADAWVVESLLEQLPPLSGALGEDGGGDDEGGCGGGCNAGGLYGITTASLSFVEWNAAAPQRKWADCLEPLLARVCTTGSC